MDLIINLVCMAASLVLCGVAWWFAARAEGQLEEARANNWAAEAYYELAKAKYEAKP